MKKYTSFLQEKIYKKIGGVTLLVVGAIFFSVTTIFAAPPTTQYNPGEILDPLCAPGDMNCSVRLPANIDIEKGSGVPASTPALDDPFVYINEDNGDMYSWDGAVWKRVITNPAGLDTQVQFNNGGAFGGSSDFTWDDINKVFNIGDVGVINNGTFIKLDDINQSITFSYANNSYTFPVGDGTNNQVLQTNGAGQLSWQTLSSNSALTQGYIGFGDNSHQLTGQSNFSFDGLTFKTPNVTVNNNYSLPSVDGSTNQVLQTNGAGNLSWVTLPSTPSSNNNSKVTTNYRIAREQNITYKEEDTQIVQIPEFDDPLAPSTYDAGGANDLLYIQQHDILFSTVRNDPPAFTRFNNPNDLTDYDNVIITGVSPYTHSNSAVYSEKNDKIYLALSDLAYTQKKVRILEIDPITLAYSIVIDYNIGTFIGYPKITIIDNNLYVVNSFYKPGVYKFNLDTFTFDTSLIFPTLSSNGFSAIGTDGKYIYIGTYYNSASQTVAKIDASTMILEDSQAYNFGTYSGTASGILDEMVIAGNNVYIVLGGFDNEYNDVIKINKQDLSDYTRLNIGENSKILSSIYTDGRHIYYGGEGGTFGRFDPETNIGERYDSSSFPGSYINRITSDGSRLFFSGYQEYPVRGTGFVGRMSKFDGTIETYVLGADGTKLSVLDKINARLGINKHTPDYTLDVNYDDPGIVARFTSTDGNCTINPAVVGGISCTSDETLKKDIAPISISQLDKLNQISPVEYHWKNDDNSTSKTIGFIAQDVQDILPELVSIDPITQKLTMSYAGLTVPLVGSVRELGLRMTSLEALNDLNINGNTNKITQLFKDFLLTTQEIFINGLIKIKHAIIDILFAKRIDTELFCIDDMCISKVEFKAILDANNLTDQARDRYNGIENENYEGDTGEVEEKEEGVNEDPESLESPQDSDSLEGAYEEVEEGIPVEVDEDLETDTKTKSENFEAEEGNVENNTEETQDEIEEVPVETETETEIEDIGNSESEDQPSDEDIVDEPPLVQEDETKTEKDEDLPIDDQVQNDDIYNS